MHLLVFAVLAFAMAGFSAAQAAAPTGYPSRPVTLVVPFAAGGGSDNIARYVAQRLSERTGTAFNVDNRPGAGTNTGNEAVARATPDGQTLLFGQVTLSINPFIYKTLRYSVKDFIPVAHIADAPTVLVVPLSSPARTVESLVTHAKANAGLLNFGSGGQGTSVHLAGELFNALTGRPMVHMPYRGSAPAMMDLMGGQVQAMFDTAPSAMPHIRNAKVRALAVTGAQRSAAMPDVPTFAEAGMADFDAPVWYGLFAPAGTPAAIVRYLNGEVENILKEPATRRQLSQWGAVPVGGSPQDFRKFVEIESRRWKVIVRRAQVVAE